MDYKHQYQLAKAELDHNRLKLRRAQKELRIIRNALREVAEGTCPTNHVNGGRSTCQTTRTLDKQAWCTTCRAQDAIKRGQYARKCVRITDSKH